MNKMILTPLLIFLSKFANADALTCHLDHYDENSNYRYAILTVDTSKLNAFDPVYDQYFLEENIRKDTTFMLQVTVNADNTIRFIKAKILHHPTAIESVANASADVGVFLPHGTLVDAELRLPASLGITVNRAQIRCRLRKQ